MQEGKVPYGYVSRSRYCEVPEVVPIRNRDLGGLLASGKVRGVGFSKGVTGKGNKVRKGKEKGKNKK